MPRYMENFVERKDDMYLIKNYRNYIPFLSMIIVLIFLNLYLGSYMYNWPDWTEMIVIILPFILVPVVNVISIILNTHKLKTGRLLYISILYSYVLQFLPVFTLMIDNDDKGMGIIQGYFAFLIVVDAITFVYPWIIYPNRNQ